MMGSGLIGNLQQTEEVAPGTVFFPYFGNVVAFTTSEGLVIVDTSLAANGPLILKELRERTDLPVRAVVYTHGHIDHVGGTESVLRDASDRGYEKPRIFGQRNVIARFRRYERMAGWTRNINSIQFGVPLDPQAPPPPKPVFVYPTDIYDEGFDLRVGGESFELKHGIGETDDHTWVWVPSRNTVCSGDFFVWTCPNVGNPWKVQRYAEGWADGLEAIAAIHPTTLIPGHGPVIQGDDAVQTACADVARYLRSIAEQVVERMNKGQWLEQILREVEPPADLIDKPYLQPIYGHPKFIVQGVWRQYGGWYDGSPADFFPAPTADQAAEVVRLAGAPALLARARDLQATGDLPLACHLVEWVCEVEPENAEARRLQRDLFQARADADRNLMSHNTFKKAAADAGKRISDRPAAP
jgi:alkyl sulfatase BDS1-like metallo-beta-lactamase superfamily hydrolase